MNDVGIIGLGVMGRSLAINMANNGYRVSGYNRTDGRINKLIREGNQSGNIYGAYSLEALVESLSKPRVIFLMTKSGSPVDEMIEKLIPLLDESDIILDGGNSYYEDTMRRNEYLKSKNLRYLGVGVSGGEYGALHGPSIMVGGDLDTYQDVEKILSTISAKSKYGNCSTHVGEHGAGHYVKMVHNGIEYGIMQVIAEAYQFLKEVKMLSNDAIAEVFKKWNEGRLGSYLMEISIDILLKKDDNSDAFLVDLIMDQAEQKGTGAWTVESAIQLGIPIPSINAAVVSRNFSHFKTMRQKLNSKLSSIFQSQNGKENNIEIDELEKSLILSNYLIFSQGLWLISTASEEFGFGIDLVDVLKIWSNGCIIRAKMLDEYIDVLAKDEKNVTLLNDEMVASNIMELVGPTVNVLNAFNKYMIPSVTISASIDYLFSIISDKLPMNLIQAQRDYFGAHTYKRIDKEGTFHTKWSDK